MDILTAIATPLLAFAGASLALVGHWLLSRASKETTKETVEQRERERRQRLATSSLHERMKIAQESFTLWYWMVIKASNALGEQKSFEEEKKWWINNCLYLDSKARDAFWDSIIAAENYSPVAIEMHFARLSINYAQPAEHERMIEEHDRLRKKLLKYGSVIQSSIDVPSWNEERIDPMVEQN